MKIKDLHLIALGALREYEAIVNEAILENKKDIIADMQRMQLQKGFTPINRRLSNYVDEKGIKYREFKIALNPQANGNWDLNVSGALYRSMFLTSDKSGFTIDGTDSKIPKLRTVAKRLFGNTDILGMTLEQRNYTVNTYILTNLQRLIKQELHLP